MNKRSLIFSSAIASLLMAVGCAAPTESKALEETAKEGVESVGESADELTIDLSSKAIAYDLATRPEMIHGIAGDGRFIFVTEPLVPRVEILDRFTGRVVGEVPPPPGGWVLPFTLRVPEEGRLVILDAGGFPNPTVPAVPRVYDYDYSYSLKKGLKSTLKRTVRFDGLPVVFSEDVEVLSDGSYVVSDSVIGSLWVIKPNGAITPGIVPTSQPIAQLAPCTLTSTTIEGIPFDLGGGLAPGVGSLAERGGYVYFGSTCRGGVQRVPVATLKKPASVTPEQRAADIQTISAKVPGTVELLKGLTFNKWKPNERFIYAGDSTKLKMLRINIDTGAREVLADEKELFNFPTAAAFLPPILGSAGLANLVVASDQEHRFVGINAAISENMFLPQGFTIAEVVLFPTLGHGNGQH